VTQAACCAWRIAGTGTLPLREWDGDYIVYNPLSGNTHVLDIVSGKTLTLIAERPRAAADVCTALASYLDVSNDTAFATDIARVLDVLDELGLIEPVDRCASRT
jgi:PqqD family protein of HPr-rel-A system